jgi:hypothetical protein
MMNMLRIKWMLIRRDAVAVIDLFTPSSSTLCLLSVLGSWKMKSGEREERGHLSKKEFVLSSEFTRWRNWSFGSNGPWRISDVVCFVIGRIMKDGEVRNFTVRIISRMIMTKSPRRDGEKS